MVRAISANTSTSSLVQQVVRRFGDIPKDAGTGGWISIRSKNDGSVGIGNIMGQSKVIVSPKDFNPNDVLEKTFDLNGTPQSKESHDVQPHDVQTTLATILNTPSDKLKF